ncbi:hypothetical protein GQ457_01G017860 [Hibiscus cannabinus]
MATIAMHKWEKFITHPGSADPQKRSINVTLVQSFYAHLTSPTQSAVYVRGEQIQFTAAKLNKFYGLQNTADNHFKFVSGLKGKSNDFLLLDLCIPGADWDSANAAVERDRLNPDGKLWMHFIKQSLIPTNHTATASLSRLQLLHSILNGQSIDVGKIIEELKQFAAARLVTLTTMAETTRDQLEELKTDLDTYFKYVQERDQVIKAKFNEMLPQSSLNFPHFPQYLLKPAKARDKPLGFYSASSSPTPPATTPQPHSPPTQRKKGKEPINAPATLAVEIDSEETAAFEEEEEPQCTLHHLMLQLQLEGGAPKEQEDEVLKARLERRRSCSISARQCGTMLMLKHSGNNLGALEDKMEKRTRVQPTPTRDPI